MRLRGQAAVAVGLATLVACHRADPVPEATATPASSAMTVPVRPGPTPSSPEPSAEPPLVPSSDAGDAPAALTSYRPRDECAKLPGFPAFRDALFAAVAKRDAEALVAMADPAVHLDFGGGAGHDELRKRLADPKSGLWSELGALAPLGCAADGTVATLPAIFSRVPEDVDAGRTMLVTGSDVPLRSRPSSAAPVIRKLDWALVTLDGDGFDPSARYAKVGAGEGAKGFVATARLRSLLDYRLIADKGSDGAYRITALIAGD